MPGQSKRPENPLFARLFESAESKGNRTKIRILESAMKVLASQGIDGLTFEAVAKPLGMTRSHLVYHFPDKQALIHSCVKLVASAGQSATVARLEKAYTWEEQLNAMIHGAIDAIERNPEHGTVLMIFYHYCSVFPEYRKMNAEIRELGVQRIFAILKSIPGLPGEMKESSVRGAALAIQGIITGNMIESITSRGWSSTKQLRSQTLSSVMAEVERLISFQEPDR